MAEKISEKKEEEEKASPLIEYFYIIGPNPETIKIEELYDNISQNRNNTNNINAKILSKFPPVEKPLTSYKDEIIISHCFPNGYNIKETNPGRQIFHFSLDNIFPQQQGEIKIFFTCIKFYEPLSKYYDIKQRKSYNFMSDKNFEELSDQFEKFGKMKRQSVILKENPLSFIQKKNLLEKYYLPKVICFSSIVPFPYEFGYLLNKLINYTITPENEENSDNNNKSNYKALIIPIEKIIEKIVMEIPMPMRGIFHIKFQNNNEFFKIDEKELIIKQKLFNEYYSPTYTFQSIFAFNSNDIIEIYKSLLLEIPILFFSSDIQKLTNIFQTFMCLLYPLKCQCPNISILPDINSSAIQNFETFVFGINQNWINVEKDKKDYFERNNLRIINKAILICDIDKSKIEIYFKKLENEHIVNFKDLGKYMNSNSNSPNILSSKNINHENKFGNTKYSLPSHYIDKVKKKLDNFKNNNKNLNLNEYNTDYNKQIGEEIFFYFLISILGKYNNYLYNKESEIKKICKEIFIKERKININTIFNTEKFIHECKSGEINFYKAFFKTEIFSDFIRRKYYNRRKDKSIFLNFDENIIKKRNKGFLTKKYDTPFITLQIFDNSNSIEINKYTNFNEDELKYILENKKELLDYYQTYNGKEFKYLIFPKLLYDNKFFNKNNNNNYILNYNYDYRASNFTKVYKDLIQEIFLDKQYSKIYTGDLIVQDKHNPNKTLIDGEIQNSLNLLWLRMFCLTFYYCDKNEKNLRFYEMINITKRLTYIKDDIFSLILSTLDKYGTEIMMIQFFSTLSNYNYIQYSYLSHKLIKENQIKSNIKSMSISNTSLTINYYIENQEEYIIPHINQNDIDNIRERTFGYNNNNSKEEENAYFSHNIKCNNCGENLEISGLTLNYKGMIKSLNLLCQCQSELTNKISIKLNGKYYKIFLYEPYYLYKIISFELLQKYGNRMPLDELRTKYKDFYWNCIWYFGSQGLSYDMLLKYRDDKTILYEEINNEKDKKEKETSKQKEREKIKNKCKKRKKRFECLEISHNNNLNEKNESN